MTWTNARTILKANNVPCSHGWDSTLQKLNEQDLVAHHGKVEDALIEHILCGEKFSKLYPVDPKARGAIQAKIVSLPLDEGSLSSEYPYLVSDQDLTSGDGNMSVVRVESNEDGVGAVLSSIFHVKRREEIPFADFENPKEMASRYQEVVGLTYEPMQLFHVVWMPHHRDFLEIRVDHPRGVAEADAHGMHSILKKKVNSWGCVALDQPVNLFPAVRPFYEDMDEGVVTQMTFLTTTGGIKDEKMPRRRRNADQRTEKYHVAGRDAVEAIAIYRIAVEWSFSEDEVLYQPSVSLAASGPSGAGGRGDPTISGALIKNCVRAADYEFVIERLGKKAQFVPPEPQE
ncbi:hypothetical protein [Mameliella alba]|uniref:hypothetical protein n=1 Tax=Mameliella alba TaxID=561184 RepID=UPI001431A1F3|nr:hypothetical protein [Mameliella alba]